MVHISPKGLDRIIVRFPYNDSQVQQIKQIPGRLWDVQKKQWSLPCSKTVLDQLTGIFNPHEMVMDETFAQTNMGQYLMSKVERLRPVVNYLEFARRQLFLRGMSHKTIRAYTNHLKIFQDNLGCPIEQASLEDIHAYILKKAEGELCSHSYIGQLISALKFFYEDVLQKSNFLINIPRPKKARNLPDVLSEEEVRQILTSQDNIKHKVLLMMAYSSGLRVSEVVSLKISDIDSSRMLIHVRRAKGQKDRFTVLSKNALQILRQYSLEYKPNIWLFPGVENGHHLTERTAQRVFETACQKAGIHKKVSIHSLRHSFATHLLESGTDIRYIQELLGHSCSKTTEIYTHVSKKEIGKIISPLDRMI